MTPEELEQIRNALERERQDLLAIRDAAKDSTRPVTLDQASVGRLSRMDAMQGQAMAIEAQRRRDVRLKVIQSALTRIGNGGYGHCADCEEEIAPARLKFDPAATLCIDCATEREGR